MFVKEVRKTARTILHCDLNSFFASVALLDKPNFVNEPVAVCGNVEERHGIILAKNEIARKMGVKTAATVWEAKLNCPNLILLPPDYKKYKYYSYEVRKIYARYTDLIEPFGIDECWLDVTDSRRLFGSGEEIANRIRVDIKKELGLTVSVGVSFNKVFAKLGSDMKKPDGLTVISKENFKEVVWKLPVEDLLFVGGRTKQSLNNSGIFTIGDLAICDEQIIKRKLGKNGVDLHHYALGEDNSPVLPDGYVHIPKSISRSQTFKEDIGNEAKMWEAYIVFSEEISRQLKSFKLFATSVQIILRLNTFEKKDYTAKLDLPTDSAIIIARAAMKLFNENCDFSVPYRAVGVRVFNLQSEIIAVQQDIFTDTVKQKRNDILEEKMFEIQNKFGKKSIHRGSVGNL